MRMIALKPGGERVECQEGEDFCFATEEMDVRTQGEGDNVGVVSVVRAGAYILSSR